MNTDIRCVCPKCKQHIDAPSDLAGTTAECPMCGNILAIPNLPPAIRINKSKKSDSSFGIIIGSWIAWIAWIVFVGIIFFVIFILIPSKGKNTVDKQEQATSSSENVPNTYPSIEQVNTFPEKYIGQSMVFKNCRIFNEVTRLQETDYFALQVTSKGGQVILMLPGKEGITFVVSKAMAEKMVSKFEGGIVWVNCTITCKIEKITDQQFWFIGGSVNVAVVNQVEVFTPEGRAVAKFTD
jgi:hypothetical protein